METLVVDYAELYGNPSEPANILAEQLKPGHIIAHSIHEPAALGFHVESVEESDQEGRILVKGKLFGKPEERHYPTLHYVRLTPQITINGVDYYLPPKF